MAQTALSATRIDAVGSETRLLMGVAGGTSTSTVVTLPGANMVIEAVLVGGATSATAPYCDTISGQTFTVTHGNTDLFVWQALVKGGI